MKIVFGLGNPGTKYALTRHNAGFLAINSFLRDISSIACQSKFQAQICELHFGTTKTFFVKPQTFMNNSGETVRQLCHFYKIDTARDLLIVHDEKDLPFGTVRTGRGSSAAGHNGVQSVIDQLGTKDFHRVRIGVETRTSRTDMDTADFVLANFSEEELVALEKEVFPKVREAIETFITLP